MDAQGRIAELEAELTARDARIAEQDTRIAEQDARIEALMRQVAALTEKLGRNSGNSSQPPSSDPPGRAKEQHSKRKPSGKKRGGQRGHRGHQRELIAAAQVDTFVELFPAECENCWEPLPETADPLAHRYQFTEVPPIRPHTTEVRRHAEQLEAALGRAVTANIERVSGSCADILAHQQALWTFVERLDVEPTNNHAERVRRLPVTVRRTGRIVLSPGASDEAKARCSASWAA